MNLEKTSLCCQAQPQLNSTSISIEAELVLFSFNTATHPPSHPTGKVVKWNKTTDISIEDF